jgi:hypothetical protein
LKIIFLDLTMIFEKGYADSQILVHAIIVPDVVLTPTLEEDP